MAYSEVYSTLGALRYSLKKVFFTSFVEETEINQFETEKVHSTRIAIEKKLDEPPRSEVQHCFFATLAASAQG